MTGNLGGICRIVLLILAIAVKKGLSLAKNQKI